MKKFITRRNIYLLIEFISLLLAGYNTYRAFWFLLNDYGSGNFPSKFGQFSTNLPFYLYTIISIYFVIFIHHLLHPKLKKEYTKKILINGIILSSLSLVVLIYTFILIGLNKYYLIMSNVTPLFPLDIILYSFIIISYSIYMILRREKIVDKNVTRIYFVEQNNKKRKTLNILKPIGLVFSLYYIGLNTMFFVTYDYSFKHFLPMTFVYILTFIPLINIVIYELFYELKNNEVKQKLWLLTSFITIITTTLCLMIIFLSEIIDPNFLTYSGTALFPVDHMLVDSPAFGIIITSVLIYSFSIPSFIFYLSKKKNNELVNIDTFEQLEN